MNRLLLNGNFYIDTDATITDDPDEEMDAIVEEIESLIESKFDAKLNVKFVTHEAELMDEQENTLGIYET